ncbi:copper resistance CopC/CopD family protein [Terrabacter sp. 2RAF25]|uniref:copper resistance CopC/CopD family protein n=1 Tax=Terrabacter sp. 2RAF25 TaxID=3232998 RepID=UPI003F9E6E34
MVGSWLLLVLVVVGGAGRAAAHAQLERSDPSPGKVLAVPPAAVALTFGEAVDPSSSSITVFDDHLRRITVGAVSAVGTDGTTVAVPLPAGLARGTYTVAWSVSSADTHPVTGSFRFSVGAPSTVTAELPDRLNDVAGVLLGVARDLGFVGLALAPGLLLAVLVLWPAGVQDRRTRRLLWTGLGLLVLSTLGGRLLQGAWASGASLSSIWSSPSALDSHSRRFDQLMGLRFYLVVGFAVVLAWALVLTVPAAVPAHDSGRRRPATATVARRRRASPALLAAAAVLSVGLLATWALAGHAAIGDLVPLAVVATVAHLLAMCLWLGGLVLVAVSLTASGRAADLAAVLPHFSRLAFGCVGVMVGTGAYLAWREVASLDALTGTEYGWTLLAKVAGVAALVLLGNLGRLWVRRHVTSPAMPGHSRPAAGVADARRRPGREQGPLDESAVGRLRRGVVGEVAVGFAVLALTSALVVLVPARQDYVEPFHATVTTSSMRIDLDVPNPRAGDIVIEVRVHRPDGARLPLTSLRATIASTTPGGPRLPLEPAGSGGASATGETSLRGSVPTRGTWTLQLTVQTGAALATSFSQAVPIS